jgi:hypothetical protein
VDSIVWLPLPTLDGKRALKPEVVHLLVEMHKYRGNGINIVFGGPLPLKLTLSKPDQNKSKNSTK